ncbi:hypothetical protein [Paraliomyxa miuraensis]|uniref:hypothetical protein n=1 Tax=Paraliomyxa miuraensis TaxID=376150 RepID=UPI0022541EDB|nr:hypothetical protein [Paraliomyxa miuraensis]MCX4239727.1 hypothetical protein [Paraliomyxa miuraensis]
MQDATTTNSTVEPTNHAAGGTKPADVVVRYRYADGVLLVGKAQPHREVKKAQPRWRWFSKLRRWGVPRTRGRVLSSDQVEEYAQGLRVAGVPNVRVDYEEPQTVDELDLEEVETLGEQAVDSTEQLDGPSAWLGWRKPLTAGDFVRWFPRSHRNAMALVHDVRVGRGLEVDEGQEDEDPYARALRDAGLHVPEPEYLGQRAARERARRKQELVFRRDDARALTEVRRVAASLGPVTPGRFNAAYRQLYPMLTGEEHRQRALVLTYEARRIVATVRGPNGTEFSISRSARAEERAVIAALLYRIEAAIPRSVGQPRAQAIDPAPEDTQDPNVDVDALDQEPGAHATTPGTAEPETVVDMMQAIEELTRRLFGGRKHGATAATPGAEAQEGVDGLDEEPVDTEDGSAGPEAVEQEDLTLDAGSGESTGVHVPTEHPSLLDVSESDPAALELAEHGSRRPPPATCAPLLTRASSEAPPSSAEDAAPPTAAGQVSPQGTTSRQPRPTRRVPITRTTNPGRYHQACPRSHGLARQAQAPSLTRQHDGQAQRGRSPPTPRGPSRMGPRNRGPPPHSRQ